MLERSPDTTTGSLTGARVAGVAAVLAATLVGALDQTIVGTVMPTVVGELGGIERYAWAFSAYLLLVAVATPICGRLADVYGRKPVYLAGLGIFVVGSALAGLAGSMEQLVLSRAVQGAGAGALFPVGATIIGDLFDARMRARMQGVFSAVWTLAAVFGPAIGSFFVQTLTWRWAFFVNVPVGICAGALIALVLRETHVHRESGGVDVVGAIVLSGATVTLLVGLSGTWPLILLPAAVGLALLFVRVERRTAEPLVDLALLRVGGIGAGLALTALEAVLLFSVITYVPPFAQGVQGARPIEVGAIVSAMSIGWSAGAVFTGTFLMRLGVRRAIRLGVLLLFVGAAILVTVSAATPLAGLAAAAFASGLGIGTAWTAILVAVQSAAPIRSRGIATGLAIFTQSIGASIGVGALGALLAASLGPDAAGISALLDRGQGVLDPARAHDLAIALGEALHRVYIALAAIAVVALFVAWRLTGSLADRPDATEAAR